MSTLWLGVIVFIGIVVVLSLLVMALRRWLLPMGPLELRVQGGTVLPARQGDTLLQALQRAGILLPAACGGIGSCGQCRVAVVGGGGEPLPSERARLDRRALREGTRLACQLVLREPLEIRLPDALQHAAQWTCRVARTRTLAPLIRELVLQLPAGTPFSFQPGSYVMLEAPPFHLHFSDLPPPREHVLAWQRLQLERLEVGSITPVSRAYSIANVPESGADEIVVLVRLALPPPNRDDAPPGVVSSWLFSRKPGDSVQVSGPFGDFRAQETDREMVFIGGGVGMAPLRAMITHLLQREGSTRRISYWYGARSRAELFFAEEFDRLAKEHGNFHWTPALSAPLTEDEWSGETGFIHEVLHANYLAAHPAPEECEYYLCGPPLMIRAVMSMLDQLGVDPERIFNDDFGSP